jgi:hypothetical protein
MITRATFGRLLPALAVAAAATGAAAASPELPMDKPTTVDGVEAVCTGIGDAANNPLWKTYPLKIMLAGKGGAWLTDADVTVTRVGKPVVSVFCGGAWILLKLEPGRYHLSGTIEGHSATTDAVVPVKGQGRAVLRFPNVE